MAVVRRIAPEDRDAFQVLLDAFFRHASNPIPAVAEYERFFARIAALDSRLVFFGAFDDGRLLGIASVVLVESSYRLRPFAWCDDVYVVETARGGGVGSLLLDAVRQQARAWGATSVLLGAGRNAGAQAFYLRSGFRDLGSALFALPLPEAGA